MLPPILIGGAALAVLALLKSRQTQKLLPPNSGGLKNQAIVPTDAGNNAYLLKDLFSVGASGVAAYAAAAQVAGYFSTSVSQIASRIAEAIAAAAEGISAGAAFVLIVVVVMVIFSIVMNKLAKAKEMGRSWQYLLPNGRHFVSYETTKLSGIMKAMGRDFSIVRTVRDDRVSLNQSTDGKGGDVINFMGFRDEYSTNVIVNAVEGTPSFVQVQKAARTIALEFIYVQGKYAAAMLRNWGPKIGMDYSTWAYPSKDFYANQLFNDSKNFPNYSASESLGGLLQIPLPGGYTEAPRLDKDQLDAPAAQLRGANADCYTEADLPALAAAFKEARYCAFMSVLQTISQDTGFYFPWQPQRYANDVYNRMELADPFFLLIGTNIVLPYNAWGFVAKSGRGVTLYIDVIGVKDGSVNISQFYNDTGQPCLEV